MAKPSEVRTIMPVMFCAYIGQEQVASCLVADTTGGVMLFRLETEAAHRNQGHGTEVVLSVLEYYGERNVVVYVIPEPFGDSPPLTREELDWWYRSMGFEGSSNMLRKEPESDPA